MRWDLTISLLVYTFGVYCFGSILFYHLRGMKNAASWTLAPGESRLSELVGLLINAMTLVWFTNLAVMSLLAPEVNDTVFDVILIVLQWLYPPVIMNVVYADLQDRERRLKSPIWKWLIAAMYLLSIIFIASILSTAAGLIPRSRTLSITIGFGIAFMFVMAAVYSAIALRVGRDKAESVGRRSSRRAFMGLFGLMIGLVALIILGQIFDWPLMRGVTVVGTSMPLLFCVVAFYHEARFEFFDLFLKRGLAMFITLGFLTLCFAVTPHLLGYFRLDGVRPLAFAVLLLPAMAFLPWLHNRLFQFLDNWWLARRFTPTEAITEFLASLQAATTEPELLACAETGLSNVFQAPARIDLELREAPPLEFDCVHEVPIRSGAQSFGVIRMGQRAKQTPYFGTDRTLLTSLAEVFASVLQNHRLQERKQEQEQRARQLSLQASRSELKALRAQINPHFLFNALNAIAGLIHKDPFRADNTVEQLAEVFRYTLRGSEKEWALLEDELDFVQAYLEVEQARFGERLKVSYDIDNDVRRLRVPTMIIQTLVENAVKHGVAVIRGEALVGVAAGINDDKLVISVTDNGPGFEETPVNPRRKGTSYGLKNIRERFAGYFGSAASLSMDRDEERGLTVVRVTLPLSADGRVGPDEERPGADSFGVA